MPLPESCKETTGSFVFQGFPCEGHVFAFQIGIPTDHPIPAESLLHSAPALALSCKACRFHKILRPDRLSFDFVGCPADRWKKAHTISTSPERLILGHACRAFDSHRTISRKVNFSHFVIQKYHQAAKEKGLLPEVDRTRGPRQLSPMPGRHHDRSVCRRDVGS